MILFQNERFVIRTAKEEDIETIIYLENHSDNRKFLWQGTYEDHLKEITNDGDLLLIFESIDGSTNIGFALIRLDDKSEIFELRRIAIDKKGLGYGYEAISLLMEYCFKELQYNRFWLDVYPDNKIGIKLYKKLNMKHEGTLRQSYKSDRGYLDQMIFSILKDEYFNKI